MPRRRKFGRYEPYSFPWWLDYDQAVSRDPSLRDKGSAWEDARVAYERLRATQAEVAQADREVFQADRRKRRPARNLHGDLHARLARYKRRKHEAEERRREKIRAERLARRFVKVVPLADRLQAYKAKKRADRRAYLLRDGRAFRHDRRVSAQMRELEAKHRRRRSTVPWYDLVPDDVAQQQIAWEMRKTAAALRDGGMKYRDIRAWTGVTTARTMVDLNDFYRKRGRPDPSPVECYLAEPPFARDLLLKNADWLARLEGKRGEPVEPVMLFLSRHRYLPAPRDLG